MKKLIASLAMTACLAGIPLPVAAESAPLTLVSAAYGSGGVTAPLADGGLMARDAKEITFTFSEAIDPGTTSSVTATDSTGAKLPWLVTAMDEQVTLHLPQAAPKNSTITVSFAGGETGLRSATGTSLATNLTFAVKTDDRPGRQVVTVATGWGRHQAVQSEIYRLEAGAGNLSIRLNNMEAAPRLILEDAATGAHLLDKQIDPAVARASVDLPRAGTYRLLMVPNITGSITFDGIDVTMGAEVPVVQLPEAEPYETRNVAFAVAHRLLNPESVESVTVSLNDRVLSEGPAAGAVTIDPATLEDGLYALRVAAKAPSGNQGLVSQSFLVDRTAAFRDVPGTHWARRHIEVMHHLGIINGRGAGLYAPEKPVTRAEFAKLIAMVLGVEPSASAELPEFADVPQGFWAEEYVVALAEQGLIRGEVVGEKVYFRPDRTITRAEAAVILGRALGVPEHSFNVSDLSFADGAEIPAWAAASVAALAEMSWIQGFPDGKYYPQANLQRDQAARVLANFLGM